MLRIGRLNIGGGFLFLCAAAYYVCRTDVFLCFILSAALHETGHLIAAFAAGVRIKHVNLSLFGAEMRLSNGRSVSYAKEILLSLSGPLASLSGAVLAGLAAARLHSEWLYFFAGANALLGLFNLLPAAALDGGRALYFFIRLHWEERTAYAATAFLTAAVTLAVFAGGIAVFLRGNGNLSALALSGFLAYGLICGHLGGACKKGIARVK